MEAQQQQCRLTGLPNELLVVICELIVIDDAFINIVPALKQPALSQTCSTLRHITLPIWYTKDQFVSQCLNFDRSLAVKFARVAEPKGLAFHEHLTMNVLPVRNEVLARSNLLAWAKDIYMNIGKDAPSTVELGFPAPGPNVPLGPGQKLSDNPRNAFFCFLIKDFGMEWEVAGKNKSEMRSWELKKPVIEGALQMTDLSKW